MLANLLLGTVALVIGVRTRQRWRYWLSTALAIALQRTASVAIAPVYRSVREVSDATGDPTPALWMAIGLVVLGWVAPVLVIALGYTRRAREMTARERTPVAAPGVPAGRRSPLSNDLSEGATE
jgi:hypothetical protein